MDVTTLITTSCTLTLISMVLMVALGYLMVRLATGGLTGIVGRFTGGGDPEQELEAVRRRDQQAIAQAQSIRERKRAIREQLDFEATVAQYRQGRPLSAQGPTASQSAPLPSLNRPGTPSSQGGLQPSPPARPQQPRPAQPQQRPPYQQSAPGLQPSPPAQPGRPGQRIPDANPLNQGGDFDSFQPPGLRRRRDHRNSDDYQEIYDDQDGGFLDQF